MLRILQANPPPVRGPGVPPFLHALQRGDALAWLAIVVAAVLLLVRARRR